MIQINCIYAKEASQIKIFLRKLKNHTIINYMDIMNKLTKNDVYSNEPSDLIINSYIIKLLEKLIVEKEVKVIYYVMSNVEHETIYNLKEYINSLSSEDIHFSAYIKDKDNYRNIHYMFKDIYEIVNLQMHKHRIFNKGEQVHCLLSSFNHPNILIPVKGIIKDYQWDDINLRYLIKITKFYDSLPFLKKYLFDMNFYHSYDMKARKFKLKDNDFKNVKEIENALTDNNQSKYYLGVDSIMTTKTKLDLQILFNKIQHFLISRHLKNIKELSTRAFYKGTMRLESFKEFDSRLYRFMGDLFEKNKEDFNRFAKGL